jgi:hypothetical protein
MNILQIDEGVSVQDRAVHEADVVIANGVIVKNREGKLGDRVGKAMWVWDERPASREATEKILV